MQLLCVYDLWAQSTLAFFTSKIRAASLPQSRLHFYETFIGMHSIINVWPYV